ncbi:hypothetical protein [Streptomyces sp. NPDC058701]|uniref:hypothetical protein n=1 Tax=Streptomyces sp. NPDC058701 TaxID=3346608 RepID=UPI003657505F
MEHAQNASELREQGETRPGSDGPDPVVVPVADAVTPDAVAGAAAVAPPRRSRSRTTLLIAAAAVLGVLAGTITGYAVQYHRAPTPLPPLAQQNLVAPKALAPDDSTTNKTVNANRWHKNDGDLAELLIEVPDGAKPGGKGYDSLDVYAATFEEPDLALRHLAGDGLRRVAATRWSQGDDIFVEVQLIQFNNYAGANDFQQGQSAFMPEEAGNAGVAIPGMSGDLGHVWVNSKVREKPGFLPVRSAAAIARRGDIVMGIVYYNTRGGKIAEGDIVRLAERQLERL